MKNKTITITVLLLIISIGNYVRIIYDGSIRTVEFVAILAIGIFIGVLLTQIIYLLKSKR